MQGNNHRCLQALYGEALTIIQGVNFTPREIDVISCLINMRGTAKMSALLSISPNTVLTHTRHIMLKLECNSREGIIDFIERSSALPLINAHYAHLSLHAAFEKGLNNVAKIVAKLGKKEKHVRVILYEERQNYQDYKEFLLHLESHLKQVGIKADVKTFHQSIIEKNICNQVVILILGKADREKIPYELFEFEHIDLSKQKNYYFLVCEILEKFLPNINATKIFENFTELHKAMKSYKNETPKKEQGLVCKKSPNLKNYKIVFVFVCCFICFICCFCLFFQLTKDSEEMQTTQDQEELPKDSILPDLIRSDLPIPIPSVLLDRPEEMTQIHERLRGEAPIQTIALVGPGGIGKTILSRQYAQQQKAKVIWEFNAETQETLKSSFEDLAEALARTEKDQKILIGFQEIKDSRTREKKLIQFVKQHLRSYPSWFLIYDNMEAFQEIRPFFPQDAATWGQGKIILTTRNSNIQNNKYVMGIIQMKELNPAQKLTLFLKIATNGNPNFGNPNLFTEAQEKEADQFLENIPSFPLDVSVAAYYLKTTSISYELYLDNLNKNSNIFKKVQEKILKETGNYIKTRYGIIILSLQNLMKDHKNSNGLLLLISLLDSQNIPKSLLDAYQKDVPLVDNFLFDLNKYSLITNHTPFSSSKTSTFSIHRSTQAIILDYLIKVLNLNKNHHLLQRISKNLENYIVDSMEKEDLVTLKLLVSHCERFLSHDSLLTEQMKHSLRNEQAGIYLQLGNYLKAKYLLENNLSTISQETRHSLNRARALTYLGNVYGDLGQYEKAKTILEQSVSIYQRYFPENYSGFSKALAYLGNVHRDLGNFEKARELLEHSFSISQKHLPKNSVGTAWISAYLGITYTILGKYNKAISLLEQSLLIYKNHPKNVMGVAWVLAHRANLHAQLGEQEKAKALFEQSIALYKEHFPEGHIKTGWALSTLGETYRALKEYAKAKDVLEQSLKIYKKHLVDNHIVVAGILVYLGAVHKDLGDFEKAKDLLDESLVIYKKHFPPDHVEIAWALAHLGDIHRAMGENERAKALLDKSLLIYKKHFPEDHVEVIWASECLKTVSQKLGEHGGAEENRKDKSFERSKNREKEKVYASTKK